MTQRIGAERSLRKPLLQKARTNMDSLREGGGGGPNDHLIVMNKKRKKNLIIKR